MPVYDYRCQECGKVSEIFLRSLDGGPVKCSYCDSGSLERLISSSYVIRSEVTTPGTTCCGRTERCDAPPCSVGDSCRRR